MKLLTMQDIGEGAVIVATSFTLTMLAVLGASWIQDFLRAGI
jgi:hypothetical protein